MERHVVSDGEIESAVHLWPASIRVDDDVFASEDGHREYRGERLRQIRQDVLAAVTDDLRQLQLTGIVYSLLHWQGQKAVADGRAEIGVSLLTAESVRAEFVDDMDSVFLEALEMWPESISIEDGTTLENGGAYFPALTNAHAAIEARVGDSEPVGSLAWAIFTTLHARARRELQAGVHQVYRCDVDELEVLRRYHLPL